MFNGNANHRRQRRAATGRPNPLPAVALPMNQPLENPSASHHRRLPAVLQEDGRTGSGFLVIDCKVPGQIRLSFSSRADRKSILDGTDFRPAFKVFAQ